MMILLKAIAVTTVLAASLAILFFFPIVLGKMKRELNQLQDNTKSIFGSLIAINLHFMSEMISELEDHIEEEIQNDNYELAGELKDQVSELKKNLNEQREIFRKHFNGSTVKFQG